MLIEDATRHNTRILLPTITKRRYFMIFLKFDNLIFNLIRAIDNFKNITRNCSKN